MTILHTDNTHKQLSRTAHPNDSGERPSRTTWFKKLTLLTILILHFNICHAPERNFVVERLLKEIELINNTISWLNNIGIIRDMQVRKRKVINKIWESYLND